MILSQSDVRKRGLDYFRRTVALAYREIGVLRESNHAAIFSKANSHGGFFGQNRKAQAKKLYKISLSDNTIQQTLKRYTNRTGLTLEEIHEAFATGQWSSPSGKYDYGGPKWAAITKAAMKLGLAIQDQVWPEVARMTDFVGTLQHNNGPLVNKFSQLD